MTSNLKIAIIAMLVLIITFSVLILEEHLAVYYIDHIKDKMMNITVKDDFYSREFSTDKTIFLLGSSHVGHLNVNNINDLITSDESITVYNLARFSDMPNERLRELEQIISAKPYAIFYGISY